LLKGLNSGFGGQWHRDLLKTTIDINKEFDTWRFVDYAARDDDSLSLLLMSLLAEWDLTQRNEDQKRTLEIAAEHATLQCLAALLDLSLTSTTEELFFPPPDNLLALTDGEGDTPLLIAARTGKSETIDFVIRCNSDIYCQNKTKEHAIDLAWEGKFSEAVIILLKSDSPLPENLVMQDINSLEGELKTLIEEREHFHPAIQNGKEKEILPFIICNPCLKKVLYGMEQPGKEQKSALMSAFAAEQFELYALLQLKGFALGQDEQVSVEALTHEQKNKLKEANLKYVSKQDNSHIDYLRYPNLG
jgi:hypothetical protein